MFNNAELQGLYDQLVEQGLGSELEAFKVGALIEEVDIEDLELAIAKTDIVALKDMYTSLLNGSYNHLRAFTRQIITQEGSYIAQLLSQERVDEILAGEHSMAMGNANKFGGIDNTSSACFVANLNADQQTIQNGSAVAADQSVKVTYQVKVDANDVGATAEWVILANYVVQGGEAINMFARNGDQWETWSGPAATLPAAVTGVILQSEQEVLVLDGVLGSIPGEFTIMMGYRLGDNSVIYSKYPLVFTINP